MRNSERIVRIALGLIAVGLILFSGFAVILQLIPTWGARPTEVARTLPGDELISKPTVNWTHAITIDAPPAQVWGWIAQIGERRGAFYSYTFIENQVGNGDVYHNATSIVPEWQTPHVGDVLIGGALPMSIYKIEPGKYMVAYMHGPFDWAWGWHLEPINADQTRLVVRMQIQMPAGASSPIADSAIGLGGFMMEQAMLKGIQARAEGNIPPARNELFEIALWVIGLAAGIAAAVFFVTFREWVVPLCIGLFTVIALLVFTFVQPVLWLRLLVDVALWLSVAWVLVDRRTRDPVQHPHRPSLTLKPTS